MRHTVFFAIALTLSSACSACASLPMDLAQQQACKRVNTATLAERVADPCGYAIALADCVGVRPADRMRILERCKAEEMVLDLADVGSERHESHQGSTCAGNGE